MSQFRFNFSLAKFVYEKLTLVITGQSERQNDNKGIIREIASYSQALVPITIGFQSMHIKP